MRSRIADSDAPQPLPSCSGGAGAADSRAGGDRLETGNGSGWGPVAADFAAHAAVSAYNALYDRPAVLELLGPLEGKRVLDAGCGPGLYAEELVERGAEVVAFDQSPEMVALAKERLAGRAELSVHDLAAPLDWLTVGSFDLAVMALVIHHVDDRVGALREIHRVLKSDGALVVSTHHPTRDWLRGGGGYFEVKVVEETWSRGWQVRFWRQPLTETCAEFYEAGFVIERLVEPRPVAAMAEQYPEDYAKLEREPGFIMFRLVKQPARTSLVASREGRHRLRG
jgi:SAM-dependent methyltransferase